jgi:hypothetical protein
MRIVNPVATSLLGLLLFGCASFEFFPSMRLPLCPAFAEASYPSDGQGKFVNRFLVEQAEKRSVHINVLSEFTADFYGTHWELDWFKRNYRYMLCGFDPKQVVRVQDAYHSCMTNAAEWIRIVQSEHPEDLMRSEYYFYGNCAVKSL